jgi:hypothetical protein
MTAPKTSTLVVAGLVLILTSGMLSRPAYKHKLVSTPSGEVARVPDRFGTFMINWDAHLLQGLAGICLVWATGRAATHLLRSSSRAGRT